MKKVLALIIATVFLPLTTGIVPALAHPVLAQQAENGVGITFTTAWVYESLL